MIDKNRQAIRLVPGQKAGVPLRIVPALRKKSQEGSVPPEGSADHTF